ncbi:homoserine O-acetyltransferase [Halopelagius inordinatus]|uniref:Homoserine O-acetyltransferase n=1 Tax=Halopelagius inordinatus TaxID=553467 RepID=A0A1I2WGZ3_9EURY|nr:homoserine O-acetyltransferase [Halopelagius inordinatus]SFG99586.1 homoserine O-acetyltransferase [Halopelagius inordinatus]
MKTDSGTVDVGTFDFECGEEIPNLRVAYESYGEFDGDNAVLVCHALTGSQNVAGYGSETTGQARAWWNDIVGPGKAIDTNDYFVVCANVPGSCYGTSGPPSDGPDGDPYGTDFPPVTVGDWTRSQRLLLDELGVGRLHAVVGGSVGGMNALDWAKRYPDDVRRVASVAAAPRLDPQCLALDAIARRAITTDPGWNGGDYYDIDEQRGEGDESRNPSDGAQGPKNGLALARQLGHVMYLSKSSMEQKFGRRAAGRDATRDTFPADPAASFFPYRDVESYLDYQAEKFVERFDANSYLYLTRAMDDYDLSEGYEDDTHAVAAYEGQTLLMSFTGDWHFTTEQSEALAESFRDAEVPVAHHVVESDHGHDAFLVEPEKVGPPLRDFLDTGISGRSIHDTDEEAEGDDGQQFAPVHNSLFSG